MFRKYNGVLSEQCLWTHVFPSRSKCPSCMRMTLKASAGTKAALEDLFVPNKFADACSCSHINQEVSFSMLSKLQSNVVLQMVMRISI